ncbi:hypothetical protein J7E93_31080 [Streptomyces sp. ISL-36]|nr:hypothetical protein [Streptomyces sp. ISL-36]MBT2444463.1 hypothetical protein [Streptomyces sp. ISL-36]
MSVVASLTQREPAPAWPAQPYEVDEPYEPYEPYKVDEQRLTCRLSLTRV